MKNLRFFDVGYKSPTNYRGSRVVVKDLNFNKRRTINYKYGMNSIADMAIDYLQKKGIVVIVSGETNKGYLLGTTNFTTEI